MSRIDLWRFAYFSRLLLLTKIRDEARWWRRNRANAPKLFRQELRRAFKLIVEYPEIGALAEDVELPGVRRILLVSTHHYLYYRPNKSSQRIEVLAIWSTSRGEPPPINAAG
jgi:plasmid stabilization system protein ParE